MGRSTASAPRYSIFARVVSKCVLFGTNRRDRRRAEKNPFARSSLVRGKHVLKAEDFFATSFEDGKPASTGIGLVAPIMTEAHCSLLMARAAVRQQVDEHIFGSQQKWVVARPSRNDSRSSAGHADWLDALDAKRLDNRFVVPSFSIFSARRAVKI